METLLTIHRWYGYVLFLLVLLVAAMAFNRGRNAQEFSATPFSVTMVLIDIQVLLGAVYYVAQQAWEAGPMVAYVHPALMVAALGVGHAGLGRARREQMVQDAHRKVGRAMVLVVLLVGAGIGVATAS